MKSVSRNYFYNLAYQIFTMILPFITTPYLARALGAEAIGVYSFTMSIVTYFALFGALGTFMYGQREIAYVQNDKEKRSKVFWEVAILRIITMIISMVIFSLTFASYGDYQVYYKILFIELVSQALDIAWFFQGIEDFKKTVIRNLIIKIAFMAFLFIVVKTPDDLWKYVLLVAASNLLGNFSLWLYLPKYVNKVKIKNLMVLRHLKNTISLFIPQIAMQIYTVLDRTMIGQFIEDKSEVGFYEQAQKVVKMLLAVVTSLGTVMVPRMANTFVSGDTEQLKNYIHRSFQFVFFIALPMIAGLIVVSDDFVPIFFGEGYEKVSLLINVISPILLFIGISNILGSQYLLTAKRQKEFTVSVTIGAIINFILNLIVIPKYGALGASITTVIAEFTVAAVQFYYVRDMVKIRKVLKLSLNYLISAIIMFLIVYAIGKIENIDSLIMIIIQAISGGAIYLIMLLLLKDEFCCMIKDKIFSRFSKSEGEK